MSSLYVMNAADSWATSQGLMPYYNTINQVPDPQDDMWFTLDFNSFENSKETYCGDVLEEGVITLIFFGRVGLGYQTLVAAAEAVAQQLDAYTDPTEQLVIVKVNPAAEFAGENNPWFVVEITADYQHRSA